MLRTFPKFTTRVRNAKAPEAPPPHTIMPRGRCDLVIGPHRYRDTLFYEVHYMQSSSAIPAVQAPLTSITSASPPSTPSVSTAATAPSDDQQLAQLKLALGGGTEYTISADLVARIHYEASVNPIFATKFRLAVEPNATQEQIRNFAFALPHLPGVTVSGAPTSLTLSTEQQQQVRLPPVREWDVVMEFNETPNERWLIPRGTLASCSRLVNKGASMLPEASLTLRLPLPDIQATNTSAEESKVSEEKSLDSIPPQAIKFMLPQTPDVIYDLILRWIGGDDKNAANAAALAKIPKRHKIFLPHRIAQGALFTQLQAAQTPNYTLKPLKQGSSTVRSRRKPQKPRPTQKASAAPAPTATLAGETPDKSATTVSSIKPGKSLKESKEVKRRRYQTSTKPAPMPIRCLVCFKTDVPLMMGGRYCRECVDAGKANIAIPQLPPRTSQSSPNFSPYGPSINAASTPVTTVQASQSVSASTTGPAPSPTVATPQLQTPTQTDIPPLTTHAVNTA
ncbi:hypothetical protein AGABI2DRAFT_189385 [Agaricus bisporus var. bisporus H97]|uniref:hypothetical protein n=1 Tax=Agaricus bisporus var. bisporus (strain H97 / ATCC MYA-4626 / FGSC 10389) TaxID=936046 RepID=UPI00029F78EE|nr:hypothetical protein AGABI2DRAFT_189385 [Agaricus bisporus var. bisporus H97]EKV51076.1 hypothetical protein AGABI2DRAFT_189385 [Agaricus bisporus var. bisporus H97]